MSTAGRATYVPAIAKSHKEGGPISQQYSARDLKAHTKLKFRQPGQGTKEEVLQKNLRRNLEDKEHKPILPVSDSDSEDEQEENEKPTSLKEEEKAVEEKEKPAKNLDADDSDDSSDEENGEKESEGESESESEEEEEDDTAELMKELEKIKREREAEAARREMEGLADRKAAQEEQLMGGNPLLRKEEGNNSAEPQDFSIKKRWYDDSVFKNQTKGEAKVQKRFINDTIRNDFHRKFMAKYIQ